MTRYHLFAFYDDEVEFHGNGGMNDYVRSFDAISDAKNHFAQNCIVNTGDVEPHYPYNLQWTAGQVAIETSGNLKVVSQVEVQDNFDMPLPAGGFDPRTGEINISWKDSDE